MWSHYSELAPSSDAERTREQAAAPVHKKLDPEMPTQDQKPVYWDHFRTLLVIIILLTQNFALYQEIALPEISQKNWFQNNGGYT